MATWDLLTAARDTCGAAPGVRTSRVGFEANMTAADYPMVRIVPSRLADGATSEERECEVLIYFGEPMHEFTAGLEAQWQALLTMEADLLDRLSRMDGAFFEYRDTLLDEDRMPAYKCLFIRGTLQG